MSEFADFLMVFAGMVIAGAGLTALFIMMLMPVLKAYAMARPNARSSHKVPTPQGGGIAILLVVFLLVGSVMPLMAQDSLGRMAYLAGAVIFIAIIGAFDDIKPLPVAPRLLAQIIAVAIAIIMTRTHLSGRIFPEIIPSWLEDIVLVFAGVWFVNLVNFMDGLDWLSVAEFVPITAALLLLQLVGYIPFEVVVIAAALLGGMVGFAFFNKPVARLFMGDVGSLPLGLLLGWMLLKLAETGSLGAALLLPLYYLMDATITLLLRIKRKEKLSQAHRSHFYQRATTNGYSVMEVAGTVFGLNIALALLAASTFIWQKLSTPDWPYQLATLIIGMIAVSFVLYRFSKPKIVKEGKQSHA
ncbi:glycosyl transferase [Microvirga sp. W0021]|uniref:Glycosyl transferase n=1 Tax=Hohaiivirga grylli TaxID=3133970 RepID=A0ABV0BG51_9HYPH